MRKSFLYFLFTCFTAAAFAQRITREQYIEMYKSIAISEQQRSGVPAAITLAQGLLETESGNSDLVKRSNNHFGIKCKAEWTGARVTHDDDALGECFRAYNTAEESYRDHSDFLKNRAPYAPLFRLDPRDYKAWAYGLKKAGYATNPAYPQILIKNIEDNNLQQYSLIALNGGTANNIVSTVSAPVNISNVVPDSITQNSVERYSVINRAKVIWALKGTSLLALASKQNINLSRLLELNDMTGDGILQKDQYIFLDKKAKEGATDFYMSLPGETCWDVAQKNGIRLQNVFAYNIGLTEPSAILPPGTKVLLRAIASTSQRNVLPSKLKIHEVQPKEGLFSISKKYGVTVSQIKEWNNLQTDSLRIGQQLIVSK